MKTFAEFIAAFENGKRTGLGLYPPAYSTGQYPPLYFAPIAADHQVKLKNHGCKCKKKGECDCSGDPTKPQPKKKTKKKAKHKD